MLAYEPAAHAAASYVDAGCLGRTKDCHTVLKQHVEVAVDVRRRDRARDRAATGQCDARREGAVARVEQHSAGTAIVPKQHVEVVVACDVRRRDRTTHGATAAAVGDAEVAMVEATVAVERVAVRVAEARAAVKAGKTRVAARVAAAVAEARAAAAATAAASVESALAAGLVAEARAAC